MGLFGWLLERRHGPFPVLALFLIGGVGGLAATTAIDPNAILLGAQGGALALVCAWAMPDLLTLRAGGEVEGDLIGAGVIAVAVALMPLADPAASWVSDAVGDRRRVRRRDPARAHRRALRPQAGALL